MGKTLIWTNQTDADLIEAFLDLLEESKPFETTIRVITEIYKLDPFKENKSGNIRTYETHTY